MKYLVLLGRLCAVAIPFMGSLAYAQRLVLVAGGTRDAVDVPAVEARLNKPFGVDQDPEGNLVLVEYTGGRVLRIDRQGMLTQLAGSRHKTPGDGEAPLLAEFNAMHSLAVSRLGQIYIADTLNHQVRVVSLGIDRERVYTLAGTGHPGFSGDGGRAADAQFNGVYCVALAPRGDRLYVADLENRRIRSIDLETNIASTVAGNGQKGVPADGAKATDAPLVDPRAVAADANGNVYILERGGHALRVVDSSGRIRTVAGSGKKGPSVDQAPALQATFNGPKHLCVDRQGNVIIADTENHVIRKYLPAESLVVQIAGTGARGSAGLDGAPLAAQLSQPHGVFVNPAGTLYIVDSMNDRLLKVTQ